MATFFQVFSVFVKFQLHTMRGNGHSGLVGGWVGGWVCGGGARWVNLQKFQVLIPKTP